MSLVDMPTVSELRKFIFGEGGFTFNYILGQSQHSQLFLIVFGCNYRIKLKNYCAVDLKVFASMLCK